VLSYNRGPARATNGVDDVTCRCGYRGIWVKLLRSSVLTVIVQWHLAVKNGPVPPSN